MEEEEEAYRRSCVRTRVARLCRVGETADRGLQGTRKVLMLGNIRVTGVGLITLPLLLLLLLCSATRFCPTPMGVCPKLLLLLWWWWWLVL